MCLSILSLAEFENPLSDDPMQKSKYEIYV